MERRSAAGELLSVSLRPEPDMREELKRLLETAEQRDGGDAVIDFSHVDIVTSASLSSLIRLRRLLDDGGRRLILCGLRSVTRGVFEVAGLEALFEMCEHRSEAMSRLQADAPGKQGPCAGTSPSRKP